MSLNWLFLDMNAYFASVEQQLQPRLRQRPVAVVPVMVDSTCCIAASYEAKLCGVKTGTNVGVARKLCPELQVVEARPEVYVEFHEKILAAVDTIVPVEQVHSIDEMSCRLTGRQRDVNHAITLARQVKEVINLKVGRFMRCSVGLATNRFLAKIASNIEKPDGLTVITNSDLPHKLYSLSLSDLPGIGRNILGRLNDCGIQSVQQLCSLSVPEMAGVWQSVIGRRWWHLLRGCDLAEPSTHRQTISHSHVLSPEFRTDEGARAVLIKLIHKAAARLRRLDYWAGRFGVHVSYSNRRKNWKESVILGQSQDTQTMVKAFSALWSLRPRGWSPYYAAVVLSDLTPASCVSSPLFPKDRRQIQLSHAMDAINERFGAHSIYFGSMHDTREAAPMRISFTHIPDVVAEGRTRSRGRAAGVKRNQSGN
jgi:DNA polymerase-4